MFVDKLHLKTVSDELQSTVSKINQFSNFCCSAWCKSHQFMQIDASLFALSQAAAQKVTSSCWAGCLQVNLGALHVGATASTAALTSHFTLPFRLACP